MKNSFVKKIEEIIRVDHAGEMGLKRRSFSSGKTTNGRFERVAGMSGSESRGSQLEISNLRLS